MAWTSGIVKKDSPFRGAMTGLVLPSQRSPLGGASTAAVLKDSTAHRLPDVATPVL
jgi:hypothetical protein